MFQFGNTLGAEVWVPILLSRLGFLVSLFSQDALLSSLQRGKAGYHVCPCPGVFGGCSLLWIGGVAQRGNEDKNQPNYHFFESVQEHF